MISKEAVLRKMKEQVELAMKNEQDEQKMLRHIANIKLLTELFLEEDRLERKVEEIQQTSQKISQILATPNVTPKIEEKDGTSIFDF